MILTILQINSTEIKKLAKEVPENLTKEEIYECAYEYYEIILELQVQIYNLLEAIENKDNISKDKDDLIIEYEKIIEKYKKMTKKYGFGINVNGGLNQELRADCFVNVSVKFYFLNGRICLEPGVYVKMYDNLGGGLSFGFSVNF
jgi:hypothetical protein